MEIFFSNTGDLIGRMLYTVFTSVAHNWKILAMATLIAVALKTYVNNEKLNGLLVRKRKISIIASVLFGAFTPFCACGTSAVVLGMLTTTLPWGPIMAFLTSSPLMSPDGFVFISGIINTGFAVALTAASVVIGISSGFLTNLIEKKTHYLENQSRYLEKNVQGGCSCDNDSSRRKELLQSKSGQGSCSCAVGKTKIDAIRAEEGCCVVSAIAANQPEALELACCGASNGGNQLYSSIVHVRKQHSLLGVINKLKFKEFAIGLYELGIRRMLLSFSIFIAIGYLINSFVPESIISAMFGANAFYAVPLASLIGLPLYITTESGVPIIQSMIANGASEGAMLAFIITGSATSAWVIAGLSTFMKKRAILLYIAFILMGGILSGYLYDVILMFV